MLPTGIIVLWFGSLDSIPAGWILCDGNNGTPNLQDRFVRGAGNGVPVDDTGGSINHNHAFTGDGHVHAFDPGIWVQAGSDYDKVTSSIDVTGTTDAGSSLPPYHALAYIMKT